MNSTIKTILLTVLTLSIFAIALVELSGVSTTAFINKYSDPHDVKLNEDDQAKKDAEVQSMPKTYVQVIDSVFNFGKIKEGEKVRHTYRVVNTGKEPLVISNVTVSCGCTAPFFPKEPILPGKEGEVTLEFNSAGKEGQVHKNALIVANAYNAPYSIGFDALVEKK